MKRFERWAAQHEMLREAAFVIARRDGPKALTRRGLAAVLGASEATARRALAPDTQLATLAASACEARRRVVRRRHDVVDRLLPDPEGVDLEVVWLRLRLAYGTPQASEVGADLPSSYQLAMRGYSDPTADRPRAEDLDAEREAMTPYLHHHDATTREEITGLVGAREDLIEPVLALVDGLVLAVCTGRLSPDAARAVLLEHLASLGLAGDRRGHAPSDGSYVTDAGER